VNNLPTLILPESLNYIAAFLTLECNLNCSYCINDPEQRADRKGVFNIKNSDREDFRDELTPEEWVKALSRLPVKDDLPITFQGGEPTMYWKGLGLGAILSGINSKADLLTNLVVPPQGFSSRLRGQIGKFKRPLPYPSIRVSYHAREMKRVWGERAFEKLVDHCVDLGSLGLHVEQDYRKSDVGIYMVDHPENSLTEEMKTYAEGKVPVLVKDFLGLHEGELYGQYAYPYSTDLVSRKIHSKTLECDCRTTELLIDPLGFVWRCHSFLYRAWEKRTVTKLLILYSKLEKVSFDYEAVQPEEENRPIGHMLDPMFSIEVLESFRPCSFYGQCIGCDTKLKKDRFGNENSFRTSVIIKNIKWPSELRVKSFLVRS
jgi:MoaA/NifB/PqqE/SkfB family radical SAM enzyme